MKFTNSKVLLTNTLSKHHQISITTVTYSILHYEVTHDNILEMYERLLRELHGQKLSDISSEALLLLLLLLTTDNY